MSATLADLEKPDTYVYLDDHGQPKRMRLLGHMVLVKLCDRPDGEFLVGTPDTETPTLREAEIMIAAFRGATYRNWATVLAVGPECDRPRSIQHLNDKWRNTDKERRSTGRKWRVPRCLNLRLKPGDYVCVEDRSVPDQMFNRLKCGKDTVLVDEAHIMIKIPKEEVDP